MIPPAKLREGSIDVLRGGVIARWAKEGGKTGRKVGLLRPITQRYLRLPQSVKENPTNFPASPRVIRDGAGRERVSEPVGRHCSQKCMPLTFVLIDYNSPRPRRGRPASCRTCPRAAGRRTGR